MSTSKINGSRRRFISRDVSYEIPEDHEIGASSSSKKKQQLTRGVTFSNPTDIWPKRAQWHSDNDIFNPLSTPIQHRKHVGSAAKRSSDPVRHGSFNSDHGSTRMSPSESSMQRMRSFSDFSIPPNYYSPRHNKNEFISDALKLSQGNSSKVSTQSSPISSPNDEVFHHHPYSTFVGSSRLSPLRKPRSSSLCDSKSPTPFAPNSASDIADNSGNRYSQPKAFVNLTALPEHRLVEHVGMETDGSLWKESGKRFSEVVKRPTFSGHTSIVPSHMVGVFDPGRSKPPSQNSQQPKVPETPPNVTKLSTAVHKEPKLSYDDSFAEFLRESDRLKNNRIESLASVRPLSAVSAPKFRSTNEQQLPSLSTSFRDAEVNQNRAAVENENAKRNIRSDVESIRLNDNARPRLATENFGFDAESTRSFDNCRPHLATENIRSGVESIRSNDNPWPRLASENIRSDVESLRLIDNSRPRLATENIQSNIGSIRLIDNSRPRPTAETENNRMAENGRRNREKLDGLDGIKPKKAPTPTSKSDRTSASSVANANVNVGNKDEFVEDKSSFQNYQIPYEPMNLEKSNMGGGIKSPVLELSIVTEGKGVLAGGKNTNDNRLLIVSNNIKNYSDWKNALANPSSTLEGDHVVWRRVTPNQPIQTGEPQVSRGESNFNVDASPMQKGGPSQRGGPSAVESNSFASVNQTVGESALKVNSVNSRSSEPRLQPSISNKSTNDVGRFDNTPSGNVPSTFQASYKSNLSPSGERNETKSNTPSISKTRPENVGLIQKQLPATNETRTRFTSSMNSKLENRRSQEETAFVVLQSNQTNVSTSGECIDINENGSSVSKLDETRFHRKPPNDSNQDSVRKSHHDPSSTLQNNCESNIPPSYESKSNLTSNWRPTEINFRRIQPNFSNENQNQIDNSRNSQTKSGTMPSSVEVYTIQKLPTSSECWINDTLTEHVRDGHGGILAELDKKAGDVAVPGIDTVPGSVSGSGVNHGLKRDAVNVGATDLNQNTVKQVGNEEVNERTLSNVKHGEECEKAKTGREEEKREAEKKRKEAEKWKEEEKERKTVQKGKKVEKGEEMLKSGIKVNICPKSSANTDVHRCSSLKVVLANAKSEPDVLPNLSSPGAGAAPAAAAAAQQSEHLQTNRMSNSSWDREGQPKEGVAHAFAPTNLGPAHDAGKRSATSTLYLLKNADSGSKDGQSLQGTIKHQTGTSEFSPYPVWKEQKDSSAVDHIYSIQEERDSYGECGGAVGYNDLPCDSNPYVRSTSGPFPETAYGVTTEQTRMHDKPSSVDTNVGQTRGINDIDPIEDIVEVQDDVDVTNDQPVVPRSLAERLKYSFITSPFEIVKKKLTKPGPITGTQTKKSNDENKHDTLSQSISKLYHNFPHFQTKSINDASRNKPDEVKFQSDAILDLEKKMSPASLPSSPMFFRTSASKTFARLSLRIPNANSPEIASSKSESKFKFPAGANPVQVDSSADTQSLKLLPTISQNVTETRLINLSSFQIPSRHQIKSNPGSTTSPEMTINQKSMTLPDMKRIQNAMTSLDMTSNQISMTSPIFICNQHSTSQVPSELNSSAVVTHGAPNVSSKVLQVNIPDAKTYDGRKSEKIIDSSADLNKTTPLVPTDQSATQQHGNAKSKPNSTYGLEKVLSEISKVSKTAKSKEASSADISKSSKPPNLAFDAVDFRLKKSSPSQPPPFQSPNRLTSFDFPDKSFSRKQFYHESLPYNNLDDQCSSLSGANISSSLQSFASDYTNNTSPDLDLDQDLDPEDRDKFLPKTETVTTTKDFRKPHLMKDDSFNRPDSPLFHQTLPLPKDSVILQYRRHKKDSSHSSESSEDSEAEVFPSFRIAPRRHRKTKGRNETTSHVPKQ